MNWAKVFDFSQSHDKLWKVFREIGIPDHLACLLYADQEATVRILYGTTNWLKIENGVWQGCLLSPCLFNLYTEHIIRNVGLDELQAGIKISERNSNNLRYVNGTTLMAESKEELKSLLMRLKEENERVCLRLSIKKKKKKTKILASAPITAWQQKEKMWK